MRNVVYRSLMLKIVLVDHPTYEWLKSKTKIQTFGHILVDCPTQLICTWIFICSMTKLKEHSREICYGGLSRLTVSFNRVQILKFSCLAEFGLRKGMQMVNTVLEDQKLLIQYLSNISWSHSFTKYKQPISIMHWTQYSKRWPWLQWWGEQAAFGLRWYQSGHHDIGGYAVCTLVVQCAHWLLCSAHIVHIGRLWLPESHTSDNWTLQLCS